MVKKVKRVYRYLRRTILKPYIKILCMKTIVFYQRHLSRGTCMFRPTCSEYTLRAINNNGVIAGIILGAYRIMRCNPFTKGGYDPAPEKFFKVKWVL